MILVNCDYFYSVQLQIIISANSSLTSAREITVTYNCSTKYYVMPLDISLVFSIGSNNGTIFGANLPCSSDKFIIHSETGHDYSSQLCGYWIFSNQTPFFSCPINCTSMPFMPLVTLAPHTQSGTIVHGMANDNMDTQIHIKFILILLLFFCNCRTYYSCYWCFYHGNLSTGRVYSNVCSNVCSNDSVCQTEK